MKRIKYLVNLLIATVVSVSCGESLEDTYSDYAGNGKIRYPAKCSDLEVTVGWKRLELKWNNGVDAFTDKIKSILVCLKYTTRLLVRKIRNIVRSS